jgi:hypothetical protein
MDRARRWCAVCFVCGDGRNHVRGAGAAGKTIIARNRVDRSSAKVLAMTFSDGGYLPVKAAPRKGDWIQTFTGKQFWPSDPRADEIDIIDIAAGVARDCRFGGHCLRFYTVAEHSVLMYRTAKARGYEPRIKRATLLHDASEGLGLRDMPRPVKRDLGNYKETEAGVMRAVAERFDFDWPLHSAVKALDERIGRTEQLHNMAPSPMPWDVKFEAIDPLDVTLEFWQPDRAFVEFLSAAAELGLLS